MNIAMKRLLVALGSCLIASAAYGQGTLRGVVTDSLTAETLPGANVFLVGTAFGNATNLEGAYRIASIPEGTYTLRVTYLGYESREQSIAIIDGETRVLDLTMSPGVVQGEEIVVTGQAEGQAAAINQQITSNTIVNVVSQEKIQELPDANAAESIGRLPGVAVERSGGEANKVVIRGLSDRFTSITVDGVRIPATDADARGVDLSTISQGSLAGIELFKALTPDKDADAIAGSVNLVTKKAPVQRLLRIDARGAYSDLDQAYDQYDLGLRYGERFFSNRLGVQVTGNLEQRDRSNENYNVDYDVRLKDGTDYEILDVILNYTDETRRRGGASLLLDLNTSDGGTVKLNAIANRTSRDYIQYNRNYPTTSEILSYGARDREQTIATYSSAVTGENYVLGLTGTWGASYARSESDYPFDFDISFAEPSVTDADGTPIAQMGNISPSALKGPPEAIIPFALNNFERAYLYTGYFRGEENAEDELAAYLNLSRAYRIGQGISGEFKFGGKYRQKARSRERSELLSPYYNESFPGYVRLNDGSIAGKQFEATRFSDLETVGGKILVTNFLEADPRDRDLYGRFNLYPLVNQDALRLWWELNQHGFSDQSGRNPEFERNLEADAYFYDIVERVSAGYVMNTFDLGQNVTFIAGLRVEHEDNDYDSRYAPADLSGFPVPTGSIRDTSAAHTETVLLPNAHLAIRPTDFLSIRLAAYKALARPDFNHRLESFVARKSGTFYSGNVLFIGNPDLEAAQAWNFEINTSVYKDKIGLFSVSAFYKDIKSMYHLIDALPFAGDGSGDAFLEQLGIDYRNPFSDQNFVLTFPYNSTRPTRVWGLEIEHQTDFRYLPGLLKHFVLSYNVSVLRSETYIPATELESYTIEQPPLPPIPRVRYNFVEREQKLEGQPELLANVSLGYDIGGFSARVSMFHQGEYNRTFSSDARSDNVRRGFTRWDLALKQQIGSRLALLLNLNNLTGVEEGTYIVNRLQGWTLPDQSEIYGLTADLGLRFTL